MPARPSLPRNLDTIGRGVEHIGAFADCIVELRWLRHFRPSSGKVSPMRSTKWKKPLSSSRIRSPVRNQASPLAKTSAQHLLFGLGFVGIALEAPAALIRHHADAADGSANLVAGASNAKPVLVAQRRAVPGIDLHDRGREAMREQQRRCGRSRPPCPRHYRARNCLRLPHRTRESAGSRSARPKLFPDVAAQTVAAGKPQPMLDFGIQETGAFTK